MIAFSSYKTPLTYLLKQHTGSDNGITIAKIQERLRLNSRRETEQLLELAMDAIDLDICSGHKGYFVAANAAELNHYVESLTSRGRCIFGRRRAVITKAKRRWRWDGKRFLERPRQAEMFGGDPSDEGRGTL